MQVGTENRIKMIAAIVLGVLAVLVILYEFVPTSSSPAVTTAAGPSPTMSPVGLNLHPTPRKSKVPAGKKEKPPQSLDPMLNLKQLSATEQIKYQGSGRNIFISSADVAIPMPLGPGHTDLKKGEKAANAVFVAPVPPPPPPIPLKFFGFASQPGAPKRIFLSAGEDVFIAGEGEIVDRRYKVVRIAPGSVEIQDVVGSGPPQTVPLTQG